MSQLLTDKDRPLHRAPRGDSLSTVARARTLTVLTRLDGVRRGSVVRFLYESGLITRNRPILDLRQADLSEAIFRKAILSEVYLRGADLGDANLSKANLSGADLSWANLEGVDLIGINLSGATLEHVDLSGANLSGAYLRGAYLTEADLSGANLTDAYEVIKEGSKRQVTRRVTNEQLEAQQTKSLEGATMPNGQKYEDWLKSRGREEDGEHSGPS